jgi:hypothetical protein
MLNLPSRRTFLKSLTLATAATLGSIEQIFSAIPKSALQGGFAVGPQSWTFRVFDVLTAIDKAAQAGAKAIELFPGQALSASDPKAKFGHDSTDDQVKLVKNHLASKGIQPVAYGVVGLSKDEKSSRKVFEFCKTMGIGIINSEPPAEALDTIEKLVREYDIKVGFHNHPKSEKNPNYLHWNPEWVLSVVKDRDPRIGACADTGHWLTSGLDPVAAMQPRRQRAPERPRKLCPSRRSVRHRHRQSQRSARRTRPPRFRRIALDRIRDEVGQQRRRRQTMRRLHPRLQSLIG